MSLQIATWKLALALQSDGALLSPGKCSPLLDKVLLCPTTFEMKPESADPSADRLLIRLICEISEQTPWPRQIQTGSSVNPGNPTSRYDTICPGGLHPSQDSYLGPTSDVVAHQLGKSARGSSRGLISLTPARL
ncbi:hypothetical protein BS47DRAFT_1487071, partial [Hydnum rufescens UP504]